MTKEKKKWLMQTAAVIKAIVAKRKYSEAALDVDPEIRCLTIPAIL